MRVTIDTRHHKWQTSVAHVRKHIHTQTKKKTKVENLDTTSTWRAHFWHSFAKQSLIKSSIELRHFIPAIGDLDFSVIFDDEKGHECLSVHLVDSEYPAWSKLFANIVKSASGSIRGYSSTSASATSDLLCAASNCTAKSSTGWRGTSTRRRTTARRSSCYCTKYTIHRIHATRAGNCKFYLTRFQWDSADCWGFSANRWQRNFVWCQHACSGIQYFASRPSAVSHFLTKIIFYRIPEKWPFALHLIVVRLFTCQHRHMQAYRELFQELRREHNPRAQHHSKITSWRNKQIILILLFIQ